MTHNDSIRPDVSPDGVSRMRKVQYGIVQGGDP